MTERRITKFGKLIAPAMDEQERSEFGKLITEEPAMEKKQQWIMVMNRNKHIPDREWGMEVSYSIDHHGAVEAMRKAQEFIDERAHLFTNVEFKLQGGEW